MQVNWLIGRGFSCACKLEWSVPTIWDDYHRDLKLAYIRTAIRNHMASPQTKTLPKLFLDVLESRTIRDTKHLFITTNWDYLLQREIQSRQYEFMPNWLISSHVYHLNGSAEVLGDQTLRSKFILEDDSYTAVTGCLEGDEAFTKLAWNDITVIVGMSFECEADRFFLHCLSRVEDDLPIGKSHFIVVNMDQSAAEKIEHKILNALPRASCPLPR